MGKPRASKSRETTPAVKIDTSVNNKKRTNFDDDALDAVINEHSNKSEEPSAPQDEDDEVPEEVQAQSYEIQQLRERLESGPTSKKMKKKKRKLLSAPVEASNTSDELLDASVLASIDQDGDEAHSDQEAGQSTRMRIDVVREPSAALPNKKYIGNFEISVLDTQALSSTSSFQVPKEALEFQQRSASSVKRVKYTTFMSQKRPTAAKSFKLVVK